MSRAIRQKIGVEIDWQILKSQFSGFKYVELEHAAPFQTCGKYGSLFTKDFIFALLQANTYGFTEEDKVIVDILRFTLE